MGDLHTSISQQNCYMYVDVYADSYIYELSEQNKTPGLSGT